MISTNSFYMLLCVLCIHFTFLTQSSDNMSISSEQKLQQLIKQRNGALNAKRTKSFRNKRPHELYAIGVGALL